MYKHYIFLLHSGISWLFRCFGNALKQSRGDFRIRFIWMELNHFSAEFLYIQLTLNAEFLVRIQWNLLMAAVLVYTEALFE